MALKWQIKFQRFDNFMLDIINFSCSSQNSQGKLYTLIYSLIVNTADTTPGMKLVSYPVLLDEWGCDVNLAFYAGLDREKKRSVTSCMCIG